ncbi:hypothetical protein [Glycomyces artemisiae]|uniref:hypothetical protein n=1 Tax=Glycomyces artemisiae TaxID=1076443 RepID=UPI0011B239D6|nr:hypothetical protein [Glycomyces artemisiae]
MASESLCDAWTEIERSIRDRVRSGLEAQAESIRVSVPHMEAAVRSFREVPGSWNPGPEQRGYVAQFLEWCRVNLIRPHHFASPFMRSAPAASDRDAMLLEQGVQAMEQVLSGHERDPAKVVHYQQRLSDLPQLMHLVSREYAAAAARDIGWDLDPALGPLRHAVLREGVSARVLAEDLRALDERARPLGNRLWTRAAGLAEAKAWRTDAWEQLQHFGDREMGERFLESTGPLDHLDNRFIDNPYAVACVAVGFGTEFLGKVIQGMPDYAAASGQPEISTGTTFNFNNSTVNGGQFAQTIHNTDTVIAAVAASGQAQTAQALKAVEEAVLADAHLDEATRTELLDNVTYLSEEAVKDPSERRAGVLRTIIGGIQAAAASGSALQQAMTTWGGVLGALVP